MKTSDLLRKLVVAFSASTLVFLSGCGGGGGGGVAPSSAAPSAGTTATPTTYTAAAVAGELVTYTVDPGSLSYSYSITESQYGLTGATGSGTLTSLGNGNYSLSGIPNSRIVILPNGVMLGAIRHNFGAGVQTVPVLGLSSPVTSLAGVAGTFNFLSRQCVNGTCGAGYGTFKIDSAGFWSTCSRGNLGSVTPGCTSTGGGTLSSLGGGKFAAYDGTTLIGTLLVATSAGQTYAIIDLKDPRTTGTTYGKGIVIASTQAQASAALTDGSWFSHGSNGDTFTFNLSGSSIAYTSKNGVAGTGTSGVTFNSPWTGLTTAASGGYALLAGSGVYILSSSTGYTEIGVKYK